VYEQTSESEVSAETASFGVSNLPCIASSDQRVETVFDLIKTAVDSSSESEPNDSDNVEIRLLTGLSSSISQRMLLQFCSKY